MSQGSILGPILFNYIINDLDDGSEGTLRKFAGDTKLGGAPDAPESCASIQRVINILKKRADWNLVQFNKGAYKVL